MDSEYEIEKKKTIKEYSWTNLFYRITSNMNNVGYQNKKLFTYYKYDYREVMDELIQDRNIYLKTKNQDFTQYNSFIIGSYGFDIPAINKYKNYYCYFPDIVKKYYDEHPGQNNGIDINNKLKTIEQFQAQILDKLTIFSEMLQGIQEQIEVSNKKPPSYVPMNCDQINLEPMSLDT